MSEVKPNSIGRSLSLAVCNACRFGLNVVNDPGAAIKSFLSSDFFQAGLLMGSVYYMNCRLQDKRNSKTYLANNSLVNDERGELNSIDSVALDPTAAARSMHLKNSNSENVGDKDIISGDSDIISSKIRNHGSSDVLVIGIAGGSGSGKTTFSRAVFKAFGESNMTYIMHDCYYRDLSHLPKEQRAKVNFDHPDSLETSLLINHIKMLKQRKAVDIPTYDFSNHVRGKEVHRAEPRTLVIIEGILIFSDPALMELLDIKVFIKTDDDVRLIRRMKRDIEERGRTVQGVIDQYLLTVRPMHVKYVEPSMRNADIIVPEGLNTVALDLVVHRLNAYINKTD